MFQELHQAPEIYNLTKRDTVPALVELVMVDGNGVGGESFRWKTITEINESFRLLVKASHIAKPKIARPGMCTPSRGGGCQRK